MKEISLAATPRSTVGSGAARRMRRAGSIPGVVYGPERAPLPVTIDERALRAATKAAGGTSTIINLDVDGTTSKVVLREIQRDPITSHIVHLDFHAISMKKPLHISIPIHFVGLARGVKTEGGIMQTTLRELEISCLPSDIPEDVKVDVSDLGIGDSIHVRDLSIPNAQILVDSHRTVVVISAPTIMKVEAPVAAEAVAAEAAPAEGEAAEAEKAEAEPKKAEKKEEKKKDEKKK
ncbi:MAG TPA: 50S ribosomal protein L25 [Candidatus Deferrimicrobium sp.]|nr:50S ribosomal protein L25 [Candidatus Deferrimicrobium sp.]